MSITSSDTQVFPGGAFLTQDFPVADLLTPDNLSEEHRMISQTAERFMVERVMANADKIEKKDHEMLKTVLRESAELGLLGAEIPEEYGGTGLDLLSTMLITEQIARLASFSVSFGGHSGIGTAPVRYFGNEEQKKKWLPKLAACEVISCYALTENHSGSDALAARTKAVLSEDGTHYILNGSKMWITNGGIADLSMVFAKVDGKAFTCFVVETNTPGFAASAEEHKMGLHGSSTTALTLENVKVPVENLVGEIGKGHKIALNVLNLGRFKLGAWCAAAAKYALNDAISYAKDRTQFGKSISEFGAIRYKLAQMAVRCWVGDAMNYRTAGMIETSLGKTDEKDSVAALKAIEEYVAECSILKVACSEYLDYVVDEAVQIHGGYGYSAEYAVERHYRDSRINRIFEGTNEINRLTITGSILKKAMSGKLNLAGGVTETESNVLQAEKKMIGNAKKACLLAAGTAIQAIATDNPEEKHQETLMRIADLAIEVFAMDSAWLRAAKQAGEKGEDKIEMQKDILNVFLVESTTRLWTNARQLLANLLPAGEALQKTTGKIDFLVGTAPANTQLPLQRIAAKLLEAGKYSA
ncbi:MAG: acyl-CoA dehydrogenase family protein [Candidatus Eremiobacteraeota bacterium]|nr:acyl-CoA dehydrogenase family protein [Candidatus Eremiobacteraeota bacterium]